MDKKIVVCSCSETGYDIADFLLINDIKISYFVSKGKLALESLCYLVFLPYIFFTD